MEHSALELNVWNSVKRRMTSLRFRMFSSSFWVAFIFLVSTVFCALKSFDHSCQFLDGFGHFLACYCARAFHVHLSLFDVTQRQRMRDFFNGCGIYSNQNLNISTVRKMQKWWWRHSPATSHLLARTTSGTSFISLWLKMWKSSDLASANRCLSDESTTNTTPATHYHDDVTSSTS